MRSKPAVTLCAAFIETMQVLAVPLALHASPQPVKVESLAALAVRVTSVLAVSLLLQVPLALPAVLVQAISAEPPLLKI